MPITCCSCIWDRYGRLLPESLRTAGDPRGVMRCRVCEVVVLVMNGEGAPVRWGQCNVIRMFVIQELADACGFQLRMRLSLWILKVE